MELTKEQAISEHRKMWNWIADETEKRRQYVNIDWLKRKYCKSKDVHPINDCFCCEYSKRICRKCPLEWNSILKEFMCEDANEEYDGGGLFDRCFESKNWKEQVQLARQIANLPERENI